MVLSVTYATGTGPTFTEFEVCGIPYWIYETEQANRRAASFPAGGPSNDKLTVTSM